MKKSSTPKQLHDDDYELRDEYDLATMTIVPKGRFAPERRIGQNIAVLEPELARAFPDDASVNEALRLALEIARIPKTLEVRSISVPN